jgi:hypothetical protein
MDLYEYVGDDPLMRSDPSGFVSHETSCGTLDWSITPNAAGNGVDFKIELIVDKQKCKCKNISFVQVVAQHNIGVTPRYPNNDAAYYKPFEGQVGRCRVDHIKSENDPYYGAMCDATGKWGPEPGKPHGVGHGPTGDNPSISDDPHDPGGRKGNGDVVFTFQTCAVCIDNGEVYGCVNWGFRIPDQPNSKIIIIGGEKFNFRQGPSGCWKDAVNKWNKDPAKIPNLHKFK